MSQVQTEQQTLFPRRSIKQFIASKGSRECLVGYLTLIPLAQRLQELTELQLLQVFPLKLNKEELRIEYTRLLEQALKKGDCVTARACKCELGKQRLTQKEIVSLLKVLDRECGTNIKEKFKLASELTGKKNRKYWLDKIMQEAIEYRRIEMVAQIAEERGCPATQAENETLLNNFVKIGRYQEAEMILPQCGRNDFTPSELHIMLRNKEKSCDVEAYLYLSAKLPTSEQKDSEERILNRVAHTCDFDYWLEAMSLVNRTPQPSDLNNVFGIFNAEGDIGSISEFLHYYAKYFPGSLSLAEDAAAETESDVEVIGDP